MSPSPGEPEPATAHPAPDEALSTGRRSKPQRHALLLRLDPAVHSALARWADDELRSVNAQVEMLVRRALTDAGRMPREAGPLPRRGRPTSSE